MKFSCRIGFHDWRNNCEKCSICGAIRANKKKLSGCTCDLCRTIEIMEKACRKGELSVLEEMLSKGADVNSKYCGSTLLHTAILYGHNNIVEFLLANGADVNSKDHDWNTPLHLAVRFLKKDVAELLISKGADARICNFNRQTPLSILEETYTKLAFDRILQSPGADPYQALEKIGLTGFLNLLRDSIQSIQKPSHVTITEPAASSNVSPEKFAARAVAGPAKCRVGILRIPDIVKDLVRDLHKQKLSNTHLIELLDISLLSVCPECNKFIGGKSLLMMNTLTMPDSSIIAGNSDEITRMLDGKCLNKLCTSTEHELFWCPDLDPVDLTQLGLRGIHINPYTPQQRDRIWRPMQD